MIAHSARTLEGLLQVARQMVKQFCRTYKLKPIPVSYRQYPGVDGAFDDKRICIYLSPLLPGRFSRYSNSRAFYDSYRLIRHELHHYKDFVEGNPLIRTENAEDRADKISIEKAAEALATYSNEHINPARNPNTLKQALEYRKMFKGDVKAGHSDAALYWKGAAAAMFTANPIKNWSLVAESTHKGKMTYLKEILERKGFNAILTQDQIGDTVLYRVRVPRTAYSKAYAVLKGLTYEGMYFNPSTANPGKESWQMTKEEFKASTIIGARSRPGKTEIYLTGKVGRFGATDRSRPVLADTWAMKSLSRQEATAKAQQLRNDYHARQVHEAFRAGKPIPERVLDDYPQANPADSSLYTAFHGAKPRGIRPVYWEPPKKGSPLIKVGRIDSITYEPESPSRHSNTLFEHKFGDDGHKIYEKDKPLLVTDKDGKNLYIVRDRDTKFPIFTERGIIR